MADSDLSRRKLLGGIALAGGAGAAVGTGTGAVLSEGVAFLENRLVSGTLDLRVEVDGESSEGDASVAIDLTNGDTSGEETLAVSLPDEGENNPAYAWLGSTCPESSALASSLTLELSYADCEDGVVSGETLISGPLSAVADELAGGLPLDPDRTEDVAPGEQSCLQPGDELCLHLEWNLDEEYDGEEVLNFDLEFVGRQCRHGDGTTNPLPGRECATEVPCECCVPIGKLEVPEGEALDPGTYSFDEGSGAYRLEVTETEDKSDDDESETTGVAFEVTGTNGTPNSGLCEVFVKGGPSALQYGGNLLTGAPNETGGILRAPEKTGENAGRHGISHVVVAVCSAKTGDECPEDPYDLLNGIGSTEPAEDDDVGATGGGGDS